VKSTLVIISSLLVLVSTIMLSPTFADQTNEIISNDNNIQLVKTTSSMHIPSDNMLPWASVRGTVENHAHDHPVIIQIYQNGDAIHFAQTNVNDDGSYEYKFRVRSVDGNNVVNVFEGDYEVRIFKTIDLTFDYSF